MKRWLMGLCWVVLVLLLVLLIDHDPGYFLISYGHYTLETSIWMALAAVIVLWVATYSVYRLLWRLRHHSRRVGHWLLGRSERHRAKDLIQGVQDSCAGRWSQAREALLRTLPDSPVPLLNISLAAKASAQLGDVKQAQRLLQQAGKKMPAGVLLDVQCCIYRAQEDWQALLNVLPALRKQQILTPTALATLEHEVASHYLSVDCDTAAVLQSRWKKLSAVMQPDDRLWAQTINQLIAWGEQRSAETLLRRQLKRAWSAPLGFIYAELSAVEPKKLLAAAESCLAKQPDDADLLVCLGRLSLRNHLWGRALDYFEKSLAVQPSVTACAELSRLLQAWGKPEEATRYSQQVMVLASNLPDLPLPNGGNDLYT